VFLKRFPKKFHKWKRRMSHGSRFSYCFSTTLKTG